MENVENIAAEEKRTIGLGTIVLRAVVVLNFIRFALSFLPWFEGTARAAGFADQLFNPGHTNGWRSDFVWLFFSTLYVFFAMFVFVPDYRQEAKGAHQCLSGFRMACRIFDLYRQDPGCRCS